MVACTNALAALTACQVTDRWFSPHFSIFVEFFILQWTACVSCPGDTQLVWPACWVDTSDRSASSSSKVVQDIWCVYMGGRSVPLDLILALRSAVDRSCAGKFWNVGTVGVLVLARLLLVPGLSGVPCMSADADLGAGPLVVVLRVSCIGSVKGMMLMWRRHSSLSALPLLLCCFFGVGLRRLLMFFWVSVRTASLKVGGMLCLIGGSRFVIKVFVGFCAPSSFGCTGFPLICTAFIQMFFLMLWGSLMTSFGRWWWLVGTLAFAVGQAG